MLEMSCDDHDKYTASTQFISHFIARQLHEYGLKETPIDTKNVILIRNFANDLTEDHSFDLFWGLYHYNEYASFQLEKLKYAFGNIESALKSPSRFTKCILSEQEHDNSI